MKFFLRTALFVMIIGLIVSCARQDLPKSHLMNRTKNCKFCHNPDGLVQDLQDSTEEED